MATTTARQTNNETRLLKEEVSKLRTSNSDLKDELVVLQTNYNNLVEQLNSRFEDMRGRVSACEERFRNFS
tara:strand:+ start:12 stop:224 length:213 start_codon:yes stop_codon:yes gene_type:complete